MAGREVVSARAAGASSSLIRSYRFGQFAPGRSRIVIELARPAKVLRAESVTRAEGARLEIDLAPVDAAKFMEAAAEHTRAAAEKSARRGADARRGAPARWRRFGEAARCDRSRPRRRGRGRGGQTWRIGEIHCLRIRQDIEGDDRIAGPLARAADSRRRCLHRPRRPRALRAPARRRAVFIHSRRHARLAQRRRRHGLHGRLARLGRRSSENRRRRKISPTNRLGSTKRPRPRR